MPELKDSLPNVATDYAGYAEWLDEKNAQDERDFGPMMGPNCPQCGLEPLDGEWACPWCNYPLFIV